MMHRIAGTRLSVAVLSGNQGIGSSLPLKQSFDDLDIIKLQRNWKNIHVRSVSVTRDDTFVPSPASLKPFSAIPGPKGLPLIGSLWDYLKKDGYRFNKMFEAMTDLSAKYGPVYKEKIGTLSHVVISDPLEYSKVIRVDGRFPNRVELEPMVYYKKKRNMGLGTVNSQGEEWYRNRMVVAKKTLRPKEIAQYLPAMNEVGNDFVRRVKDILTPEGHIPNLEHELFKWAFESIGTFLFEERIGCLDPEPSKEAQEFLHHLVGFFKYMQPLMYNLPLYKYYPTATWKKYEHHADKVMEIGMKFINRKVAELQAAGPDAFQSDTIPLLTHFLSNQDLSPEEANSHALDIMMGGVETTSNATLWTLYLLATTPTAQEYLYKQISTVLPNKGEITADSLAKLPYLKACLKETFRIYPITFATSRIIHADIELAGYEVPAGTHCQANLYGMGRDPKLFPDPLTYKPERWLKDKNELQALSTLTWGHGPRMCLGRRLAEQEIYLAISKLIQNFKVDYEGPEIKPVLNTVMTPDQPVKLIFKPRNW